MVVEESLHAQVVRFGVDGGLAGSGGGGVVGVAVGGVVDEVEGGVLTTHDQWQGNSGRWGGMMVWNQR